MGVKYSKKLGFLSIFVEGLSDLTPIAKLRSIKGFSVAKGKSPQVDGKVSYRPGDPWKDIALLTHWHALVRRKDGSKVNRKRESVSFIDLLSAFSHEMAHLQYWDHIMEHKRLEIKVLSRCLSILKKKKIDIKDYYKFDWERYDWEKFL